MEKIKNIFGLGKKVNKNIINYNQKEVEGFLVVSENKPIKNGAKNELKNINIINPNELKEANYYKEKWKDFEQLEEKKETKELFEELWENITKIINNNLIDFSRKFIYIFNISFNIVIQELSSYLGDELLMQRFLFLLFNSIEEAFINYIKEKSKTNFTILNNNIIYFMIIAFNLRNNEKLNYYLIKEKIEYLTCLISGIENLEDKEYQIKKYLLDILYNLFSTEYIHLDLNFLLADKNKNKDNSKNDNSPKNIIIRFYNSKKGEKKNNEEEDKKYKKVVEFLFNLDSENFLNFNKGTTIIDLEEKFFHQLDFTKSIFLILFSKEKYKYLEDKEDVYFEYDFLNKIIIKNLLETKKIIGDKYKGLFRRDNLLNDLIKYLFFIFGNKMIIECLVKPLDIILNITGINNEFEIINEKGKSLNMERDITKDEYNILFNKILEKLAENIPYFFQIFLKMIYDNVLQNYTIEKDNFIPVGVVLIFNYIASPRIQKIYSIHPHKYAFIKSMNRLLCNTCFNIEFGEKDPLNIFNEEIKLYNEKLNNFFKNNIMNINANDIENKKYLKNLFKEMNIDYPSFFFNLNCEFLGNYINNE